MEILTMWQIWLIIALITFIIEIFSNTFVFLCFCLGSLCSALSVVFTDNLIIQLVVFAVVTLISLFFIRPLMKKVFFKHSDKQKLNIDALEGKTGRVLEEINPQKNSGRVLVYGDDWKAESEDQSIIAVDSQIEVVKVDCNILIVKQIK